MRVKNYKTCRKKHIQNEFRYAKFAKCRSAINRNVQQLACWPIFSVFKKESGYILQLIYNIHMEGNKEWSNNSNPILKLLLKRKFYQ